MQADTLLKKLKTIKLFLTTKNLAKSVDLIKAAKDMLPRTDAPGAFGKESGKMPAPTTATPVAAPSVDPEVRRVIGQTISEASPGKQKKIKGIGIADAPDPKKAAKQKAADRKEAIATKKESALHEAAKARLANPKFGIETDAATSIRNRVFADAHKAMQNHAAGHGPEGPGEGDEYETRKASYYKSGTASNRDKLIQQYEDRKSQHTADLTNAKTKLELIHGRLGKDGRKHKETQEHKAALDAFVNTHGKGGENHPSVTESVKAYHAASDKYGEDSTQAQKALDKHISNKNRARADHDKLKNAHAESQKKAQGIIKDHQDAVDRLAAHGDDGRKHPEVQEKFRNALAGFASESEQPYFMKDPNDRLDWYDKQVSKQKETRARKAELAEQEKSKKKSEVMSEARSAKYEKQRASSEMREAMKTQTKRKPEVIPELAHLFEGETRSKGLPEKESTSSAEASRIKDVEGKMGRGLKPHEKNAVLDQMRGKDRGKPNLTPSPQPKTAKAEEKEIDPNSPEAKKARQEKSQAHIKTASQATSEKEEKAKAKAQREADRDKKKKDIDAMRSAMKARGQI